MKRMRKLFATMVLGGVAAVSLASCNSSKIKGKTVVFDFKDGRPTGYRMSDGWQNGAPFDVYWKSGCTEFKNDLMVLNLKRVDKKINDRQYISGELQSGDFYDYGRFECCFKAAKGDGVVSSFFTYTGPSDHNPWDEIDFEVLGKDTTKMQLNYFRDGVGGHETIIDLGFDASEDFHTYTFEWTPGKIEWFVEGVSVYVEEGDVPITPMKMMANLWCGYGVDDWLNAFDESVLPLTAEYKYFAYTSMKRK